MPSDNDLTGKTCFVIIIVSYIYQNFRSSKPTIKIRVYFRAGRYIVNIKSLNYQESNCAMIFEDWISKDDGIWDIEYGLFWEAVYL